MTTQAGVEEELAEELYAFPASSAQARLWILAQLAPESAAYNVPVVWRLRGVLRVEVLARCLSEIVRRHEVLRTWFSVVDGVPVQVVGPAAVVSLPVVGVAGSAVDAVVAQEIGRPFDLAAGPLLRALLLKQSETEHVLVLTFHHVVFDGWSMSVFADELCRLYEAFARGAASPLAELEVQYGDYAVWQQKAAAEGLLEGQLAYWRDQLAGAPALLDLPTDRPRGNVRSTVGRSCTVEIPAEVVAGLRGLGRDGRASLFMVLSAAYAVLLSRWSGQSDVCVGVPLAGRSKAELEGLIGFFVNTVVVRADVSGDAGFREMVGRVRAAVLGAFEHQDVPFEQVVEELRPERSLSYSPLFQAVMVLQNLPPADPTLTGLDIEVLGPPSERARFDLTLAAEETAEGGLSVTFAYAEDLFEASTIRHMAEQYRTLLDNVLVDPDVPVREVGLVPETDRPSPAQVVAPVRQTLPGLFGVQVEARRDAVAVVCDGVELTYGDLDERANRLAQVLRGLGAGPDHVVGVMLPRSVDLVVGLLAVLKAGAGYLPMDPSIPADRARFMLEDAHPVCVLTDPASTASGWTNSAPCPVIVWDETLEKELATQNTDPPEADPQPGNLAYVIYTSGSTGIPKAVEIAHAQVVRLLTSTEADFGFGPEDVWTLFHSYAFDFSVWELWGALAYGGRLVVVPLEIARSPVEFHALLAEQRVTVLNQTPSAFRELTAVGGFARLALRTVVFGGEELAVGDLAPWFDQLGPASPRMVNMYGITETTVHVTVREITPSDLASGLRSPIGRPLADLRMYVLEPGGGRAAVGVPGELYVGGAGLARGYLGRPALTAERFVPDPYGPPGARMYRTGDLGRRRGEHELEYLGRCDQQVKIRGFRIELGEIEAGLAAHPAVREAVVLVREDDPGDRRLVAYHTAAEGAPGPAADAELRELLARSLPGYMLPAAFVPVPAWPLTRNGKLDRAALPAPSGERELAQLAPPSTPAEVLVAEVWAEVLKLARLGADEDFFALGGHSLSAIRAAARLGELLPHAVPAAAIFQFPTVRRLAAHLDGEAGPARAAAGLVPLRTAGNLPPLFLVHPIGGNIYCYAQLAEALGADRPVYAIPAPGVDGGARPLTGIAEMAAAYLAAIAAAGHQGPYVLGGWSMGGVIAYEMAAQSAEQGRGAVPVVMLDSYAPQEMAPNDLGDATLLAEFTADWARTTDEGLRLPAAAFAGLTRQEGIDRVVRHAAGLGVTDAEDAELVARLVEVFVANAKALRSYRPRRAGAGPILLLSAVGSDDGQSPDDTHGWSAWSAGPIDVREVPGDHYGILREPHLAVLTAELRSGLDEIAGP